MSRLDARAKTILPGKARYTSKSLDHNKRVVIKELSLSGALIQGLPDSCERVRIKPEFPNGEKIELEGKVVRFDKDVVGIELRQLDMATMEALWGNIREMVSFQSNCPYCGTESSKGSARCCDCNLPLNFADKNYLKKHFKDTFLDRIKIRTDKLDAGHLEKIIKIIDKEISRGKEQPSDEEFVGTSPLMLEVFSMIRKVAPTNVNVLILGESGTGKELTAKAIHERSPRKEQPFLAINSAAIPEGLLEAELFGFEKGSFTGAHATRKGKFEQADGGTLFLDEIGDLPAGLQAKLLRFLEDRVVERIGAKGGRKVDVRIITATNCKLEEMIQKGLFRNDLFYRLDGFTIKLPPLRNRGEDKIILAQYILKKISQSESSPLKSFSTETIEKIKSYDWPGNVRELINKIRRGQLMAAGSEIQPEDVDLHNVITEAEQGTMHTEIATSQRKLVEKALQDHSFIISRSAKALGISRPSLYALMKKYNISRTNFNVSTTF